MNHLSRMDIHGQRWTYYLPADTLALFFGKQGDGYSIRLPGGNIQKAKPSEILDPAHMATGGLARWPLLQK